MGRLLLKHTPPEKLEENIFEIVNQLNMGAALMEESERGELARLNLVAGRKAKGAAAYQAAVKYLDGGLELLPSDSWQRQYHLTLDLHVEATAGQYLTAQFERAEGLAAVVLQRAKNTLDRVGVYEIQIQSYRSQFQPQPGIDTGREILAQLGVVLPPQPSPEDIEAERQALEVLLKDRQIEDLANLPEMTDPDKLAAVRILLAIGGLAFMVNPPLFIMVAHQLVNLSIKYGNSGMASGGYALYALYLAAFAEDLNYGYRFGQLSLRLFEQFDDRQRQAMLIHVFNNHIKHWQDNAKETIENLREGVDAGIENGDFEYSGYAVFTYCDHMFITGEELKKLEHETAKYTNLMVKHKQEYTVLGLKLYQMLFNKLCQVENQEELREDAFGKKSIMPIYIKNQTHTGLYHYYCWKSIILYIFKNYVAAVENLKLCPQYEGGVAGMMVIGQQNFYDSLSLLALYPDADIDEQKKYLQQVAINQKRMKKWAANAPVNYQNKYDLVAAETARVLGKTARAREDYERAIEGAKKNGFLHEEAIAYERAGEFYLAIGREEIGRLYLRNAHHCYSQWGAAAKVKDLEAEYPQYLARRSGSRGSDGRIWSTSTTDGGSGAALDLGTVMKASQAISGEIVLEKLLASLMKTVIENAGAQRGVSAAARPGRGEQVGNSSDGNGR